MTTANTQFKVENGLYVQGTANVSGDLKVDGNLTVNGSLVSSGTAAGDIIPVNNTYALGNTTNRWNYYGANGFFSGTVTLDGNININTANAASIIPVANGNPLGNTSRRWAMYANTVDFLSGNASSNVWVTSTPATFNALTGVANTTEIITTQAAHGFSNGEQVQYIVATGNTALSGLVNSTLYFVTNYQNTTAFTLSSTYGGANLNLTAGASETGHTLLPIKFATSNTGVFFAPVGTSNIGTLYILNSATVVGNTTISGNVAVDTDLLFIDSINNVIGLKNAAPSSIDLVTVTGNVMFNTVNNALRFNTATATINAYMSLAGNTTVGKLTFAAFDTSNSTVQTGGYVFNGVNSTATQSLLVFNNTSIQYKSGNVATSSNFGVYDVNGTRVGP